jgi:hypothetical protein
VGGIGSGRRRGGESSLRQSTLDQVPALDVRHLKRSIVIEPGQEQVDVVMYFRKRRGSMAPGPERGSIVARLRLAWTPCNYGSSTPWFICPGEGCGRRAAILYGPMSPPLCRLCLGLTYASQARRRAH